MAFRNLLNFTYRISNRVALQSDLEFGLTETMRYHLDFRV